MEIRSNTGEMDDNRNDASSRNRLQACSSLEPRRDTASGALVPADKGVVNCPHPKIAWDVGKMHKHITSEWLLHFGSSSLGLLLQEHRIAAQPHDSTPHTEAV